ncbi:rhamnogalacturonan acetylesterase [Sphingobacterium paludis]|jgi:lysophospholipase L1-like esterase|uniref:Lysophospholipase L1-like esterase n=1 Tax=Sphingobacterium paludis TaxID=1476465 RepID=A0A4R7D1M6_9SPHI|nr:rhamnogalacturonan acetylesterase [Sphingobacterium paludis]TDS14883.1 lysophospholipase L1-like esterase [Sphingobacterium paludis]
MNRAFFLGVSFLSILTICCGLMLPKKKLTIWMMGDSTMAIKAPNKFPETGWGVAFAKLFNEDVMIKNMAKNGRSTKSFIREGLWNEVYRGIQPGDYVLIQFGHNDEKIHKPNTGVTIDEYKKNLSLFVRAVQGKKATPILLSPIARRSFVDEELQDTHMNYPTAVRQVADSLQASFLDLTELSTALLVKEGELKSRELFLHLPKGSPNYPEGVIDNTHLNEKGAASIAALVANELRRQRHPLAKELKK